MLVSASDLVENFPRSSRVTEHLKSFLKSIGQGDTYMLRKAHTGRCEEYRSTLWSRCSAVVWRMKSHTQAYMRKSLPLWWQSSSWIRDEKWLWSHIVWVWISSVTYLPHDLEQENLETVSRFSLGKFPLLEDGNEHSSNLTELRQGQNEIKHEKLLTRCAVYYNFSVNGGWLLVISALCDDLESQGVSNTGLVCPKREWLA